MRTAQRRTFPITRRSKAQSRVKLRARLCFGCPRTRMSQPSFLTLYKRLKTILSADALITLSLKASIYLPRMSSTSTPPTSNVRWYCCRNCVMPPILPITSAATWTALGCGLRWSKYADGGSVLSLMKASQGNSLREKFVAVIVRGVLIGFLSFAGTSNQLVSATCKVMIC
ncbi:hypothetical protein ARMGADRAFT_1167048, partial [Armillaria gallica]